MTTTERPGFVRAALVTCTVIGLSTAMPAAWAVPPQAPPLGQYVVKGMGGKRPVVRHYASSIRTHALLPASVDLRAWTVPVGDQGFTNSCVGWAVGYALMGWHAKRAGLAVNRFSPMYVYSQINDGEDNGAWPTDAFRLISQQGDDTIPHYGKSLDDWHSKPTAANRTNAAQYRSLGYRNVFSGDSQGSNGINAVKAELAANRPVVLTIDVKPEFSQLYGASVYDSAAGASQGTHVVLVVGYNANGMIVQNSWGSGWGDRGFATISWKIFNQVVLQADSITGVLPRDTAMHRMSNQAGSWTPLQQVPGSAPTRLVSAVTEPGGGTEFVTVEKAGEVRFHRRTATGSWNSATTITKHIGPNPTAIALAVDGGNRSQLLSISNGRLWHASRSAAGVWSAPTVVAGAPNGLRAVAATVDRGGALHVVVVTATGRLGHLHRASSGKWSPYLDVTGAGGPGSNTSVSIAASPSGSIHVATVSAGRLTYLVRSSGHWSAPKKVAGPAATLRSVAVAGLSDGTAQFVTVTNAGVAYRQQRTRNGGWGGLTNLQLENLTSATIAGDGSAPNAPDKGSVQFVSIR